MKPQPAVIYVRVSDRSRRDHLKHQKANLEAELTKRGFRTRGTIKEVAPGWKKARNGLLLLAAVQVYGAEGRPEAITNPQWYQRKPQQRATTNDLINQLRYELWASSLKGNFTGFSSQISLHQSDQKSDLPLNSAIFFSVK